MKDRGSVPIMQPLLVHLPTSARYAASHQLNEVLERLLRCVLSWMVFDALHQSWFAQLGDMFDIAAAAFQLT